ncbi:MAG: putative Ig domain-containing protein [Methylococcaceae bacterium]
MLQVSLISIFRKTLLTGLLFFSFSQAYSAEFCSDQYYIEATLPNESKWDLCWEHRNREGIVYHHVFYTPKNGARQQVLYNAAIAQIHVPYDDNGARYHDVSDYGIGGSYMQNIVSGECLNGSLKQYSGKNVICQQIESKHIAHHADSGTKLGDALSLFSVSKVGAYHYIPQWRFFDDGTIQPSMGATGALQRYSSGNENRGWLIDSNRTGIAHLHNFFWRLDFDLGSSGTDDYVEELNFSLNSGKRKKSMTKFSTETAREVNPSTLRSWRIVDGDTTNNNGHKKSYEILLAESGHKDKGPSSEPYTHNDFFVTKANECEKFASHNPTSSSCSKNLAEFVNGESISGEDIIVWVGLTFYHMPRVEDAPHMDAHWNHFNIVPRDWHEHNPLGNPGSVNTAPTITTPGDQSNQDGDVINLAIIATDTDSTSLNYSSSGLPASLSINNTTGLITGTINTTAIGSHNVILTVSDGELSDSVSFDWNVTAVSTGGGIQIDGNDTDWAAITSYTDTVNESLSPVDFEKVSVSGDSNKVYIAFYNREVIDTGKSWAWQVLIDSDNQRSTGLNYKGVGGDYLLIGNELRKYTGDGSSWSWADQGTVEAAVNGKFAEFAIDRSIIGQSNTLKMTFYGANTYAGGSANDYFTILVPDVDGGGNSNSGIVIDGSSSDWDSAQAISDEPEADTSPVDFQSVWFKQDSQKAYFAYNNRTNIDTNKFWAWMILIDSDKQLNTGLEFYGQLGAEFMILGNRLHKYSGTGEDWTWSFVRKIDSAVNGKFAEIAVDKSDLNNSSDYKIVYYGSNTFAGGVTDDSVQVSP